MLKNMRKFHTVIIVCKYHTCSLYISTKGFLGYQLTFCRHASIYEFLKYGEKERRASRCFFHTADYPLYILVSDSNSNNCEAPHGFSQILERRSKHCGTTACVSKFIIHERSPTSGYVIYEGKYH